MNYINQAASSALILAGGNSSRFGADKAFITFRGKKLIEYIIMQLKLSFDEIIISAKDPLKYEHLNLHVCSDILNAGPLGGIHAGLKTSQSDYIFVTACDMPFISLKAIEFMKKVIAEKKPSAAVISHDGFIEPFHAFYSKEIIPEIEILCEAKSCGIFAFLKKISPLVIDIRTIGGVYPGEQIFKNINSREDLLKINFPAGFRT